MRKKACLLAIALLLTAGPMLAADRSDEQPAGLRAMVAWVLGLVGHGDVERTAPGVHQRHGVEAIAGGEAAPPRRQRFHAAGTSEGSTILTPDTARLISSLSAQVSLPSRLVERRKPIHIGFERDHRGSLGSTQCATAHTGTVEALPLAVSER